MKKKRRLKKWVKEALYSILAVGCLIIIGIVLAKGLTNYEEDAKRCDEARGYICTHYDVRQFLIKGE